MSWGPDSEATTQQTQRSAHKKFDAVRLPSLHSRLNCSRSLPNQTIARNIALQN